MFKKMAVIVSSLLMLAPVAAFASTTQTFLTLGGNTVGKVGSGDSIEAKLQFNNTGNSTVQSVWVEIPGSGFPGECLDVDDQNQTGPHTVTFTINTTGATEGTWDVKTTRYGIDSPGPGANNDCDSTIGSNSSHTFFSQLTVTSGQSTGNNANNTGGGSNSSSTGSQNAIMAALQAIIAKLTAAPAPAPAPTGNAAKCAAIAPYVNAPANTYSPTGVQLQSALLLNNPNSIPALAAGATIPMGYFGPQTHAALYAYNAQYGCI